MRTFHTTPTLHSSIAGVFQISHLTFRLLLLLVLALAAVEYLFGSILNASPLRTHLYAPMHIATPTMNFSNISIKGKLNSSPLFVTKIMERIKKVKTEEDFRDKSSMPMCDETPPGLGKLNSSPLFDTKIMEGNKKVKTEEDFRDKPSMPICDETPPGLGPISVNKTKIELDWVEKRHPDVRSGGLYSPPNCTARHRVAIIVPYRNRKEHLPIFLNHMHPFLMKQQIEYGIYIIEQEGTREFNHAKLMNVGFVESQKQRSWQCFIFHDLDLLPLDSRNLYSCPRQPRHMSASIDKLNFRLPYEDIFGGVSAMTQDQFSKVNDFSNKYWGWGAEDDDMYYRLQEENYHIGRYKMSIARYVMLKHNKSARNPDRFQLMWTSGKRFKKDGLSTLKYKLLKVTLHHLYTHILVNIDERS